MIEHGKSHASESESARVFWLKTAAGIGVLAATLSAGRLWINVASANAGDERPAKYVCIYDQAHGHDGPDVESWSGDGTEPPSHSLELPQGVDGVCYPTEHGTARASKDTHNPANGAWIKVDFAEVQQAVKDHDLIDVVSGKPVSQEASARVSEFASNWPIDVLEQQHTWVNVVRASIQNTKPKHK